MACPPTRIECSVTDDSSFMAAGSHFSSVLASGALDPLSGAGACDDAVPARPSQRRVSTAHDEMAFDILMLLRGRKGGSKLPHSKFGRLLCGVTLTVLLDKLTCGPVPNHFEQELITGCCALALAARGAPFRLERRSSARRSCRRSAPQKSDCPWKHPSRPPRPVPSQSHRRANEGRSFHATGLQSPRVRGRLRPPRKPWRPA